MTTTIPRAEVDAVLERHPHLHLALPPNDGDPTVGYIRQVAASLNAVDDPEHHAEAHDLDALANRYERETA